MKKEVFITCNRVVDEPVPFVRSKKRRCEECGKEVWLAYSTVKAIKEYKYKVKEVPLICIPCSSFEGVELLKLTKDQIDDIKGRMN